MVIRFDKQALLENQNNKENPIGVEGDTSVAAGKVSESEKILSTTKQKIAESGTLPVGVSASNSGRGYDPTPLEDGGDAFVPTIIEGTVEEEPSSIDDSQTSTPEGNADAVDVDSSKGT